jgi:hypothetical protein
MIYAERYLLEYEMLGKIVLDQFAAAPPCDHRRSGIAPVEFLGKAHGLNPDKY